MRMGRFAAIGATLVALFISALAVRADVLDQVPGDALVSLRSKT